jgi:adenine-specific DNA-methyltransferase
MNTLNYIGSKKTLSPILGDIINKELPHLNTLSFLDMFAGTGSIAFMFQHLTSLCASNDLEYYSYVINNGLIKCAYSEKIQSIIDHCNELEGIDGLMYTNYSINDNCDRMYFTPDNARKCDAIRCYLETLKTENEIIEEEFYFLLASLLVSIDKVANTSCVYGAYLKNFKKSSLKELLLKPIHTKININSEINMVFNMTAEELSKQNHYFDVVYMDPPYNQRQYAANYCPLNYLALYDTNVVLNGKTGIITGYNRSDFCKKSKVLNSFKTILECMKCKYIFISYNNEGLLNYLELCNLFSKYGSLTIYKIKYKKFKAQQNVTGDIVYEYLWFINKTKQKEDNNFIKEIEYITNL